MICDEILKVNLQHYKTAYQDIEITDDMSTESKEKIKFIQSLSDMDKSIFYSHIQQVIIDTLSNIFGIIDGSSYLEGFTDGEFELKYGKDIKKVISGSLQDVFLEHCTENKK